MFCCIFFNLDLCLLKKFIAVILMGLQEGAEGNVKGNIRKKIFNR